MIRSVADQAPCVAARRSHDRGSRRRWPAVYKLAGGAWTCGGPAGGGVQEGTPYAEVSVTGGEAWQVRKPLVTQPALQAGSPAAHGS